MAGGVIPTSGSVFLDTLEPLKSAYFFLERREMGIINVGGKGTVIGRWGNLFRWITKRRSTWVGESKKYIFPVRIPIAPAKFYLNSAPAHHAYPTQKVGRDQAEIVELGSAETSNARTIRKLIVNSIVKSCQLQMGMTELASGSVWNTMPAHVHDRRMEVYFYFEVPRRSGGLPFYGRHR